jgi:hypothetical protein
MQGPNHPEFGASTQAEPSPAEPGQAEPHPAQCVPAEPIPAEPGFDPKTNMRNFLRHLTAGGDFVPGFPPQLGAPPLTEAPPQFLSREQWRAAELLARGEDPARSRLGPNRGRRLLP